MLLYKYLAPARIDVMRASLIRFTQPAEFNDLFDLRPNFEMPNTDRLFDEEEDRRVARLWLRR